MAMSFAFENLVVYQRSLQLVERTEGLLEKIKSSVSSGIYDQLSRATLSVPLNIAEGNGRWHKPDKRNFFWIARGSVFECVPLIEILKRKGMLSETEANGYREQLTVLGKMLTNLVKAHE
jgi:four helix bundle protein